jgi:hypothetical protein
VILAPVVGRALIVRGVLRPFGVKIDPGSQILAVQRGDHGRAVLGHSEGVVEKEHRDRFWARSTCMSAWWRRSCCTAPASR